MIGEQDGTILDQPDDPGCRRTAESRAALAPAEPAQLAPDGVVDVVGTMHHDRPGLRPVIHILEAPQPEREAVLAGIGATGKKGAEARLETSRPVGKPLCQIIARVAAVRDQFVSEHRSPLHVQNPEPLLAR